MKEIKKAEELLPKLGFKKWCIIKSFSNFNSYKKFKELASIPVGVKINARTKEELREKINEFENSDFLVLDKAPYKLRRYCIEKALVDCLINLEVSEIPDTLKYRRSGIDKVTAKFASKTHVSIVFNFNNFLNSNGIRRAVIFGRMLYNMKLCRKYRTPIIITSGARNSKELVGTGELIAFGEMLGLTKKEAKLSLSFAQRKILEGE